MLRRQVDKAKRRRKPTVALHFPPESDFAEVIRWAAGRTQLVREVAARLPSEWNSVATLYADLVESGIALLPP